MTRRREVTTLCWTVPEAAESLRVSENLFREWVKSGQVRVVRWNSLDLVPTVELNRLIDEALNGRVPTAASTAVSPAPAGRVETAVDGGVGPRDTGACGEVGSNVGRSGGNRPTPPTTKKEASARTPASLTTAR